MNFSPKRVGATEIFSVDFKRYLADGETILSAIWSNSVVTGTDSSPNAMIQGQALLNGTKVSTFITGGVAGVYYAPICTVQTSLGETLILPESGEGYLPVVP